ncbi:MAG TPA: carboxypeptidase-like regulatory domain-containing protein [Bryobacteraceae bacterium]
MRFTIIIACLCVLVCTAFAQSDRGTITGTVSDPAGAVVAGAPIEAKQLETGAVYQAASSTTGNYTLSQLPTGTYELTVTVSGFKKSVRQNLFLPVAQTLRIDVTLEVGTNTESVTVTTSSPLLKTESGELSHNVGTESMDNLPVLGIGANSSSLGIRNPYAVMQLLPGSAWTADTNVRINGMPSNTQQFRLEGQDATMGLQSNQSWSQPSVDAIQEFAIETSNYAAEFGQAGGGVFNVTMRSGTNQLHGSAYEYFVNEVLNAGTPFTNNGDGQLLRPRQRRNDYGFTLGGPVYLPKLYNGHDKLFFFFSFEQYRETQVINNVTQTVPTAEMRQGNFSQILTGRNLGADPLGRPLLENTIYDPNSDFVVNGLTERNPFPNNVIPLPDIDPVASKIQALIPQPTNSSLINNFLPTYTNPRLTYIPSVKADYLLGPKSKLSGYWSRISSFSPNNNGLPFPINITPVQIISNTVRLNLDQTLTPTLLLHLGAGVVHTDMLDTVADYDPVQGLGFTGSYTNLFPYISGLNAAQGGMSSAMGVSSDVRIYNNLPTGTASLTWVRSNHTYKAGAEMIIEGYVTRSRAFANPWMVFSTIESSIPALNGVSLPGGTVGFPYASFLLGAVDNGYFAVPSEPRVGAHALSGFVQDSWKVTRKFTLDYGLRYDFQTYLKEEHGRIPYFSASTPNPSVGGRLGAVALEGYGPQRCNCEVAHNYPLAFGPRVGAAYQITSKTVLRLGAGISYYNTTDNGLASYAIGSETQYFAPSYGEPAYLLRNGIPYRITWPNFDTGQFPFPGNINSPPQQIDPNAGRPARIIQWSFGLQREIAHNLLAEATYVGNRGAWWNATYMVALNDVTPQILAAAGLSLNSAADRQLLASPLNSSIAAARGFSNPPFPNFPTGSTVAQALRPYPQFGNLTNFHWAPDGDTWYDALQTKATKRLSHGLDFGASFTWQKELTIGSEADTGGASTNDVFNRQQNKYFSEYDQPFLFALSSNYTTPKLMAGNKFFGQAASWIARDWVIGAVLRYGSGMPIMSPIATNGLSAILFRGTGGAGTTGGTFFDRVPGVPVFTKNLNCHCYDPNKTFVLNPAAWVNPPAGQFGTAAAYYNDYRYQRRPVENMSIGRVFRIKERASIQIRAEFTNIFNRTEENNPTSTNALATQTVNAAGQTTAGFGFINNGTTFSAPRQGQLVARFQF